MKCKFCDMDGLAWPENWVKGMKPIEVETGKIHDRARCDLIKGQHIVKNTKGWIDKMCPSCKVVTHYSRKHYTERTIPKICRDCNFKSFNSLDDFGVSL